MADIYDFPTKEIAAKHKNANTALMLVCNHCKNSVFKIHFPPKVTCAFCGCEIKRLRVTEEPHNET